MDDRAAGCARCYVRVAVVASARFLHQAEAYVKRVGGRVEGLLESLYLCFVSACR